MGLVQTVVVGGAAVIALIFLGAIIERRFGLFSRAEVIWHVVANAEIPAKVSVQYAGDLPFSHVVDEVKSVFREQYDDVTVKTDDGTELELNVGDQFMVTLADGDPVTLETTKLVSTRRAFKTHLDRLFDALQLIEERSRAQAKEPEQPFGEDRVTVDLYLPHKNKYIDFHLPLGSWSTEHTFTIRHAKFEWEIRYEGDVTTVTANTRTEARRLVHAVISPFLTF